MHRNSQNIKYVHVKKVGQIIAKITAEVIKRLDALKEIVVNCSVP